MVLAGMLLSDWISFVTCWCGHMANRHSLHRQVDDGPIWGTCSECVDCKQFYPEDREDRDKLQHALGIVMDANEVRKWAEDRLTESNETQVKAMEETMASAIQPAPHGTGRTITPLVIADLEERRKFGMAKYGEELTAFNGRDALKDAYQESLDLTVYLRQAIEEYDQNPAEAQRAIKDQRE